MDTEYFFINACNVNVPALRLSSLKTEKAFIFIHGKNGNKEEARFLYELASKKGYTVFAVDLSGHGKSTDSINNFNPWYTKKVLSEVYNYVKHSYSEISVFANSIGAFFVMNTPEFNNAAKALFVSPIVDMEKLILNMMDFAGVTKDELCKKGTIKTDLGETLSWEYLKYVQDNKISFSAPISILYGENDNLTSFDTVKSFAAQHEAKLTVMKNGEHWFHTENELEVLKDFIENNI